MKRTFKKKENEWLYLKVGRMPGFPWRDKKYLGGFKKLKSAYYKKILHDINKKCNELKNNYNTSYNTRYSNSFGIYFIQNYIKMLLRHYHKKVSISACQ